MGLLLPLNCALAPCALLYFSRGSFGAAVNLPLELCSCCVCCGIRCSPKETVHTNQHLENVRSLPDENNEEHQTVSGPRPNEGRRRKTPPRKRNTKKPNSRRQSLAGAGMIWEDGRRKSTRRRFRPLEHWRGERLLYGRIHESLSTVIGVKYTSPGKENFKVESYVSKQYADLVAQVARC